MLSRMPRKVFINGQLVAVLNVPQLRVTLPPGAYEVRIQSPFPYFSASRRVTVRVGLDCHLSFSSRERVWDILFSIDLLLCAFHFFVEFPAPWDWIYTLSTNAFFVIWLVYEWMIRNQYYRIDCHELVDKVPSKT